MLGLAYILLELKASRWMWIVGIAMQTLGIVLYYQKGLYADCGMEFYYLAMSAYGLWKWKASLNPSHGGKSPQQTTQELPIKSIFSSSAQDTPSFGGIRRGFVYVVLFFLALWAAIYFILVSFTDSTVSLADSFTTALSIIGIWALAHKYLEQWFVWIAVDVVTSILYFYKDIPFKASLYALYVVIAVFGYFSWRRKMASQ